MTSYLRNIFGGQPSAAPRSNHSKSHHNLQPTPRNRDLSYIYAVPGITPSSAFSSPGLECAYSMYYSTYDSGSVPAQSQDIRQQRLENAPLYRNTSDMSGEHLLPTLAYVPSMSLSGLHSSSSPSMFPGLPTSGHRPTPSRTFSSPSVAYAVNDVRPTLKQSHTWHASMDDGRKPHGPLLSPQRPLGLHMHPLLAYSPFRHVPFFYDISYTPSSRTVLDRSMLGPVPAHTLSQPATEPPTISRLVLKSDRFPWPVIVGPSTAKPQPAVRFHIEGRSSPRANKRSVNTPVTNLDVLYALYNTLATRVTHKEWEALGHGSLAQRRVTRAYEKRCVTMGGGWDVGVRRIDWLGGDTRFVGVEVDKIAAGEGIGKLIFEKA